MYCIISASNGTTEEAYYQDWRECQQEANRLARRGVAITIWQRSGDDWRRM